MYMYDVLALRLPNQSLSFTFGLSLEGHVVGSAAEPEVGVIWQAGRVIFSMAPDSQSCLYGVNRWGDAVGVRAGDKDATQIAVLVRAQENYQVVHDLTPAVGIGSCATGISHDGMICGYNWNNNRAFVYDSKADQVHWIDPLPNRLGNSAAAINGNRQIVGNSDGHIDLTATYTGNGFFYDLRNRTLKNLGPGLAFDLNVHGMICGAAFPKNPPYTIPNVPVTWDSKQAEPDPVEVPMPDGFIAGQANGINSYGDVVGWYRTQAGLSAFMYSPSEGGKRTNLNELIEDPDWHLEDAKAINDSRQITGFGNYQGQLTAFLLEPQREPPPPPISDEIALHESFEVAVGRVLVGGSGWIISLKGGRPPRPAPPPQERSWMRLTAAKRDALMQLVLDELAMYIPDAATREKVRTELLEGVQASLDRLLQSVAEGRTLPVGEVARERVTPELQARIDQILARRFGPRANPK